MRAAGGKFDVIHQPVEFFAEAIAAHRETFIESAVARGVSPDEAFPVSIWDGKSLHIRDDARPEEIVHELVHAMHDRGLATDAEINLLGGRERAAYLVQDWVALGKPSAHGWEKAKEVLSRIWDSAIALTGNTAAKQRQTTRAIVERLGTDPEAVRAESPSGRVWFSRFDILHGSTKPMTVKTRWAELEAERRI